MVYLSEFGAVINDKIVEVFYCVLHRGAMGLKNSHRVAIIHDHKGSGWRFLPGGDREKLFFFSVQRLPVLVGEADAMPVIVTFDQVLAQIIPHDLVTVMYPENPVASL
jgi:hypothetical protein